MDTLPPTAAASSIWGKSEYYEECYHYQISINVPEKVYVFIQVTRLVQPNICYKVSTLTM